MTFFPFFIPLYLKKSAHVSTFDSTVVQVNHDEQSTTSISLESISNEESQTLITPEPFSNVAINK